MVGFAVGIVDRACGRAHNLVSLRREWLDGESFAHTILYHGELVASFLYGNHAMMEALELCGDGGLLLREFKMIMHTMEQQRIFVRCDSPRLKTEKVGLCPQAGSEVDHP